MARSRKARVDCRSTAEKNEEQKRGSSRWTSPELDTSLSFGSNKELWRQEDSAKVPVSGEGPPTAPAGHTEWGLHRCGWYKRVMMAYPRLEWRQCTQERIDTFSHEGVAFLRLGHE